MYKNLKLALREEGHTQEKIAEEYLGISKKSLCNKIAGRNDFTLSEFKMLCILLHKYEPMWLFQAGEEQEIA